MSEDGSLCFQCKDIISHDIYERPEEDEEDDEYVSKKPNKYVNKKYQIILFGTTAEGKSVTLCVNDFLPYFYIRIPSILDGKTKWQTHFERWIMNGIPVDCMKYTNIVYEHHKTLWDFTNNEEVLFAKVSVPSLILWRDLKDRLLHKSTSKSITHDTKSLFGALTIPELRLSYDTSVCDTSYLNKDGTKIGLKVYEANIDPVLRFFHIRNISPAGWVKVDNGNWDEVENDAAKTDIFAECHFEDIFNIDNITAPFLVGSWDIECNSSHGDFPIANKSWKKPIRELFEAGVPINNIKELCSLFTKAIVNYESSDYISKIYLKIPKSSMSVDELYNTILHSEYVSSCTHAFESLRAAVGTKAEIKEAAINKLDEILTDIFPTIAGDEIIQIGTVIYCNGVPQSKHIWVLGTVDADYVKPPGIDVPVKVYSGENEARMIRHWLNWIDKMQLDILIGFNIFGFDSKYVYDRLINLVGQKHTLKYLEPLSCLKTKIVRLEEKFLSSSAMGDNTMYILNTPGRLQIDLLPYVRKNASLESYSLDNVSATFVSGSINSMCSVSDSPDLFRISTKSTKGTVPGRYITIMDAENDRIIDRCEVVSVESKALTVYIKDGEYALKENGGIPVRWAQVKDDVSPKDIFRLYKGSPRDRAIIARYCLQDCDLVMELFNKLEVLNNSIAMANVCCVPVSYIFTRGQGIKIESLIFKECRNADQLIEVLTHPPRESDSDNIIDDINDDDDENDENNTEDTYEGAIVLNPNTGIYIDDPVTADDFASLYPSSIISENISHDTLIWVKDYDITGKFVCIKEGSDKYDNLPWAQYVDIEFDILRTDPLDTRKHPKKFCDGRRVARYIQNTQGTIPRILEMLLANRKKCRKLAETEPDEFRRNLLDAQQLAYKLTANSLYGQLGSGTFKIRRQVLAASTTAYGRKQLMYAKAVIERVYGGGRDPRCDVECVYGDTDSIFLRFRPRDPITGERLTGKAALIAAKDLTIESGKLVSSCLKPPHDFEFDKIFRSFILLSKKRYVGDMSEDGIEDDDFHRKSMGIVMKRRDNAPIVKYIYGNVVDRILGGDDVPTSIKDATLFVQQAARDLLSGKFPLTKLTITKSLKAHYADPKRIAHKVLADRIGERDPGNKPSSNDRIPYVYITSKGAIPKLQGDRIELPSYIKEHGLTPDYKFYITNQIAKPVSQVFGLAVDYMPGVTPIMLEDAAKAKIPHEAREALAEYILFNDIIVEDVKRPEIMEARGQHSIASLFKKISTTESELVSTPKKLISVHKVISTTPPKKIVSKRSVGSKSSKDSKDSKLSIHSK